MNWDKIRPHFPLAMILLAAAALRLYAIGWSLPNHFHTATYNCDESTALSSLAGMNPARLDFNPVSEKLPYALSEGTFNLYVYGALLKVLSLAGLVELVPDSDYYTDRPEASARLYLAGRLLSVLYGLLTVWAVYLLGLAVSGRRAGLMAAFLVSIMPAHIANSRYVIQNVPGAFWITIALFFLVKTASRGETRDYVLAGLCSGLAVATRLSAAPLAFMLPLAHLLRGRGAGWRRPALGAAAALAAYAAGAPYTFLDFQSFMNGMRALEKVVNGGEALALTDNLRLLAANYYEALGPVPLLLGLAGAAIAVLRRGKAELLLLAWVLLLVPFFLKAGLAMTPGRILPALPPFMALAGLAADLLWTRSAAAGSLAAASAAAQALIFAASFFPLLAGTDIRDEASEWLRGRLPPGSSVGLIRDPSWFSPGILDKAYRRPHALPGVRMVYLGHGKFSSEPSIAALTVLKPDLVVLTSFEELLKPGSEAGILASGYSEIRRFERDFSFFGIGAGRRIPGMFYIPGRITVYAGSHRDGGKEPDVRNTR